jgi:cytidylate kinase
MKGSDESPAAMHLIERQMLLSRVRDQKSPRPAALEPVSPYRFISIARDVGALGDAVASELAQHLHWHVFDKEIVNSIAQDSRVRQDLVRDLDERSQSLIHDTVQRLLLMAEGISFGNEEYHEALLKTLAYIAARGQAIIVGRGSAYALHGEPGLHLRIVASQVTRAERLAQRWLVSPDEARRRMQQIDAERRSFIHRHFRQDLDDPRFYDAVFHTDRLSVEQIVHAVMGMIAASKHAEHADKPAVRETVSGEMFGSPAPGHATLPAEPRPTRPV